MECKNVPNNVEVRMIENILHYPLCGCLDRENKKRVSGKVVALAKSTSGKPKFPVLCAFSRTSFFSADADSLIFYQGVFAGQDSTCLAHGLCSATAACTLCSSFHVAGAFPLAALLRSSKQDEKVTNRVFCKNVREQGLFVVCLQTTVCCAIRGRSSVAFSSKDLSKNSSLSLCRLQPAGVRAGHGP